MKASGKIVVIGLFIVAIVSALLFPGLFFNDGLSRAAQQQPPTASPETIKIYQQRCAICHDNPQDRVPPRFLIARRSAEDVIRTLTTGSLKQLAAGSTA